jgi:hypothetical protein
MNTKPVENWTLNDWKQRVEELRAEVVNLKTQLQVAKSNRTQWIKDKANMQREFASQLSQRDAVHRIQKEELLEQMRIQYESDAKKLVQKLQQEHALQIQDLETLFRESSEREQAELKKQLSGTNLLLEEAQMAILKLRAELQQLHLEEQAKAEKNFQESSHYIQSIDELKAALRKEREEKSSLIGSSTSSPVHHSLPHPNELETQEFSNVDIDESNVIDNAEEAEFEIGANLMEDEEETGDNEPDDSEINESDEDEYEAHSEELVDEEIEANKNQDETVGEITDVNTSLDEDNNQQTTSISVTVDDDYDDDDDDDDDEPNDIDEETTPNSDYEDSEEQATGEEEEEDEIGEEGDEEEEDEEEKEEILNENEEVLVPSSGRSIGGQSQFRNYGRSMTGGL